MNNEMPFGRIGVWVLSGFLGAGKTTLLNDLLRESDRARTLVVVNEWGEIGIDHHLVHHVSDRVVIIPGGCMCCTVRGALVDTLRDMFMRAMRREVPVFDRVLIETSGLAEAAPVIFSLRYESFLAQRFAFEGCVTVVDVVNLGARLQRFPVMDRQIVEADVVALSKTDLVIATAIQDAREQVLRINQDAQQVLARQPGLIWDALVAARGTPGAGCFQSPRDGRLRRASVHGKVVSWVYRVPGSWRRGAFLAVMDACLQALGDRVWRVKGVAALRDANGGVGHWVVHAVHTTLYPLAPAPEGWEQGTVLVFIVEGAADASVEAINERLNTLDFG